MERDDRRGSWEDWQRAEAAGAAEAADRAFARVAVGWDRERPPAWLAARIARAAAAVSAPARPSRWLEVCAAAAVLVTGLVFGAMSGDAIRGLALASFQAVVGGVVTAQELAGAWASVAHACASPASGVGRALADALAEPVPLTMIVLNVGVAAAALAVLRRVLSVREV